MVDEEDDSRLSSSKGDKNKNLSHVPCKFFRQGACQAGDSCVFSHSVETSLQQAPCKYFQKGTCKFGVKCALAHILPDGRVLNPRSQNYRDGSRRRRSSMHQNAQNNAAPGGPSSGPVNVPPQVPSPLPEDNPTRSLYSVYVNEEQTVGSPGNHLLVGTPTTKTERTTSIWSEHHVSSRLNSFNESKPSLGPIGKSGPGNDCAIDDDDEADAAAVEDDDAGEYIEEDFFPSSLSDLLTPQERKRRGSRPSSSNLPRPIGLTMAANAQQARTNSVSHASHTNGNSIPLATSLGTSLGSNIWSPPGEGSPRFGSFFQQYYGRENGAKPPVAMSPGGSSLKNMSNLAAYLPGQNSSHVDVPGHVPEEDEPIDGDKQAKKDFYDDDTQFFMDQ
ncbi:hypothetical protein B0I72DRAFT_136084 [Yarrowia lipolytica]|uniref:YALI0B12540p n=2 Tax=Yarrowia lipolytica TaxID=4952 RepID=Q6CEV7_YARLI|nr:YALI0B12540p [Yarrowia lipolytica CLIB122]AOW01603.1 hypothetical protein YALI1_B16504g [Yarrowia lipolytica]KAB8281863.1 hypothetical protein BKA91DRAFT_139441 [Yarrowia lipolytica]KAE8169795.1 hypothetical protein BKA90DRAFT_141945 [Yarrowia lipolytica]KAJ8052417.1 hypothetical protein LXG23DRAFT_26146 [Yarrowia lipolytica]QNP96723.1 Protein cps3 [Yarrowia lipolytica]|eukprot:XP_500805.1 YALI0B12540p [Yarrowia lipolytica CLIB122]